MKVGVVLPTYNDGNQWYKVLPRFTKSLSCIENVDNLEFLILYQNVDLESEKDSAIVNELENTIKSTNPTWSLVSKVTEAYPKPISMVKIRNECMMLDPECDIYLYVDDDMKFNSVAGDRYNQILQYFKDNPDLGLVMSAGYLGGYHYGDKLKYDVQKWWMVNRGLFLRNLKVSEESPIYPSSAFQVHRGGYEEMIAAMEMLRRGYKTATHFNNPTLHNNPKEPRYEDNRVHDLDNTFRSSTEYLKVEYGIEYTIAKGKDFQGALALIHEKFNPTT